MANTIGIIVILCAGICTGCIWQSVMFLIIYATLRVYTGGYHAQTYIKCNSYFFAIFILSLACYDYFRIAKCNNILFVFNMVGFLIVGAFAPIENENKILSMNDKNKYRMISVFIYMMIMVFMIIGDIVNYQVIEIKFGMLYWYDFSLYIKTVLVSVVILMLVSLKEKDNYNKKKYEGGNA